LKHATKYVTFTASAKHAEGVVPFGVDGQPPPNAMLL